MIQNQISLTITENKPQTLINSAQVSVIRQKQQVSAGPVPHISQDDVRRMMTAIKDTRNGERDALLISVLFDSCLRVSEAIAIRPRDLGDSSVIADNLKHQGERSAVALSSSRVKELQAYCYRAKIGETERIFPFTRTRCFQVISRSMKLAGIQKPEHVGSVHVLRHSGALERLRRSGNPRELQEQLRHSQTAMTLRYLRTLSHEESIKNQGEIELW